MATGLTGGLAGAAIGGAIGGWANAYGAGGDASQQLAGAAIGGAAGFAGAGIGSAVGAVAGSLTEAAGLTCANGLGRVGGFLSGTAEGSAFGFTSGFVQGGLSTGSLSGALHEGASGAEIGAGIGGILGALTTACFAAGTPVLLAEEVTLADGRVQAVVAGSKPIEQLRVGDLVLSRAEFDPTAPLAAKRVEEVFMRAGQVLVLHVGGREIRTTPEHPFFVRDRGFLPAGELMAGDMLPGHDGTWTPVTKTVRTGEVVTVYNVRVADFHTYFVGSREWGFSVWAHNAYQGSNESVLSRENGQAVVDDVHSSLGNDIAETKSVTTLTELEDGRLVVTNSDNTTPAMRVRARELLHPDVLFPDEPGPNYLSPDDRILPDAPSGSHGEGQGIQSGMMYGSRAVRQWSASAAEHGGAACLDCEDLQQDYGVINETGFQSMGGRFDEGGENPSWNSRNR